MFEDKLSPVIAINNKQESLSIFDDMNINDH